ncbi:haloacid dehalogenase [Cordyceps fumosorosea ARSEF 2679]|uniref:Haloacid dehalogenase n=1 Tax=Cordyceps fumosorosea (strain ARSEF 2679) TaxID=1081104 RepID=A0A167UFY5_CORFA|nr:haloacid dehalogenase [Cordyceps fumosorosea ARSEF 2679]OAA61545.1 haloacid dehalogenase [Cordyceps fumosorosea ARSEF 2679]
MAAGRRNLLLCFDAFGTLFSPKGTVVQQYARVARQCGIADFSEDQLSTHLAAALSRERTLNPNYGKATGLGATQWWTKVIHDTFTPLLRKQQPFPPALVPALLRRFASDEGYDAQPDLVPALRALRHPESQHAFDEVVIGVVTNSDDRVPSILSSMGLHVSPLRYSANDNYNAQTNDYQHRRGDTYDVDFHCMSYDVGYEKPDTRIFQAAESMLAGILAAREGRKVTMESQLPQGWYKVFVGDEHAKDVVGSANAGWHPILLGADAQASAVASLEDCPPGHSLADVFRLHPVVRVPSIRSLALWLSRPQWTSHEES